MKRIFITKTDATYIPPVFPKIKTLWERSDERPHKIMVGSYSTFEFEYLSRIPWIAEEKVDGSCYRICWDGHDVTWRGKTDNWHEPDHIKARFEELFGGEAKEQVFEGVFGETPATIYGEAFGPKIQKGGNYADEISFAPFDVMIGGLWLKPKDVEDIASKLDLKCPPVVLMGLPSTISDMVAVGFNSAWNPDYQAEGVILRPQIELLDRRGNRVISKLKTKDFDGLS